jgi:hypothetical protein
VLHVPTGLWTFDDTPFVHAGVISGISINSPTWATATATWDTVGGTWQDLEDGFKKAPVYVGEANATIGLSDALYVSDPYGKGSVVSAPVDTVATAAMYLERTGIDLDEVNADLRGYKHISSIYPQGRLDADATPMEFSFGVADSFGEDPRSGPTIRRTTHAATTSSISTRADDTSRCVCATQTTRPSRSLASTSMSRY